MREGWRWFGPEEGVPLDEVRQAGATDVVSALHQVPIGAAWTDAAVAERKNLIETTPAGRTPLIWSVIESIPIPDAVKRRGGAAKAEIEAWIASLEAVSKAGIKLICYNFMPVVDWCRTDLDYETPTGSTAMRFDQQRFAVFELCILERPGAERDYTAEEQAAARRLFATMGPAEIEALTTNIASALPGSTAMRFDQQRFAVFELCILERPGAERDYTADEQAAARRLFATMGPAEIEALTTNIASALPGSTTEPLTIPAFRDKLGQYRDIDSGRLRQHLIEFLKAVTPAAEARGVTLTLHPDDPPRPLFGLPRIASTAEDYAALFDAVPSPANGMCFCTGSLGVRADNDLPAIARRFASRIGFAHLRATKREADPRSFYEAAHLEGDVDMVAVLRQLLAEDGKRSAGDKIVFRPDHGQKMVGDFGRRANPGYPVTGRLRGLAELRGIIAALEHS